MSDLSKHASMRKTTKQFIADARAVHGTLYKYGKVEYTGSFNKVTITCRKHGDFLQAPSCHTSGRGCPSCKVDKVKASLTLKGVPDFLKKARKAHGDKYDYSKAIFSSATCKITISCPEHGDFKQTQHSHLQGSGCPKCSTQLLLTLKEFVRRASAIHGDTYSYKRSVYLGWFKPVVVTCRKHGDFIIRADYHLYYGSGCPNCRKQGFSKIAIEWLKEEIKRRRLKNVQHAENGGEYKIPGTRFRVDGYHARSNTVFEFHGDRFHGNPKLFKPGDKPNPFSNKTAKQLYRATKEREALLCSLGYTVVSVWESDYRKAS